MTLEQKERREVWIRAKTTLQRIVLRPQIALRAAGGRSHNAHARQSDTSRQTVLL